MLTRFGLPALEQGPHHGGQSSYSWSPPIVDVAFLAVIAALYAATHSLIWALSRLGNFE